MTVQYYQDVLTVGPFNFLKLLTKWRGSVIKLVYKDFLVFSILYASISCIYRFGLNDINKKIFEDIVKYVSNLQTFIPITFILGFYVGLVFSRSWKHFNTVPWITKTAMFLSSHMNAGPTEEEKFEVKLQKRSIIRYMIAAEILTLSRISVPVKRRFPQISDLYTKGILLEHEVNLILDTEPISMQPFLPIAWCTSIIIKAFDQGRITNDLVIVALIKEMNKFRQMLQELFLLDHICIPLVYTQVVTLAVYTYFVSCLIGRQFIINPVTKDKNPDLVVPIFTIIQFIVYVGWLKLALALLNPMGEDDEDFDLNTVIDYNYEVGMAIIENASINEPVFMKDKYFNQKEFDLPMESQMKDAKCKPFMGSVYNLKVDDDSWVTSMRSIITVKSERNDSVSNDIKSLHPTDLLFEEHHLKPPVRSGSNRSTHKGFHVRRQPSTTSSFLSNVILPITEEENMDSSEHVFPSENIKKIEIPQRQSNVVTWKTTDVSFQKDIELESLEKPEESCTEEEWCNISDIVP